MSDDRDSFEAILIRYGFALHESTDPEEGMYIETEEFDFIPEQAPSFKKVPVRPDDVPVFVAVEIRVGSKVVGGITIAHVRDNRWWKKDEFVDLTSEGFFRLAHQVSIN